MKALILNSGIGKRMGDLTKEHPKCMTEISACDTILSRQLRQITEAGVKEVVITTGFYDEIIKKYCFSLNIPLNYTFVQNPKYDSTNYIYSIYCARDFLRDDDILLMHGDLVFQDIVLDNILENKKSCMVVSTALPLPKKDFKAVIGKDCNIEKVGIDFFENAVCAQPLYKIYKYDWIVWLDNIIQFCENDIVNCYAENAFNEVSDRCKIYPCDVGKFLCGEIDTPDDLAIMKQKMEKITQKTVYLCFSTDVIHSGHIGIIAKAAKLGKVIAGVLTDEVVSSFKRFPLLPFDERCNLISNLKGISEVVPQTTLSYTDNLRKYNPDYVVHGDDWKTGYQKGIREEVIAVLKDYGGILIEYPYAKNENYTKIEGRAREQLSTPEVRRGRLKKLLSMKKTIRIIEAHSGITGLIAEKTVVMQNGKAYQFDGMWVSSLCDSTVKGKPDIELVDMSSRMRTIDDIMEVTTKPIILDGDTGGLTEHFVYNIRTMERVGVSAVIIEDKTGLKKNSLFGTDVVQTQDSIENFCAKITAGKKSLKTKDFMLIARIESLILERGMDDALNRAFAFVKAGADGIMIHSRKKDPTEIFTFCEEFRKRDTVTPLVVVPTSFNTVTEDEWEKKNVNIVIYANQLTRSSIPAMRKTAELILASHRAKEADDSLMSINDILTLIPNDEE